MPDGSERIVGTTLTNQAFPLLRYDVGDIATRSDKPCECGRPGRIVISIDGRREDCVVTKSGCKLGRLDHIFKDCLHIREAQIRQEKSGHMSVHIVKGTGYSEADERTLTGDILKRIGHDLTFDIVYCDSIPRTSSGKLRFVVSTVNTAERRAA
jgi:phenylacetate-CoA ligase